MSDNPDDALARALADLLACWDELPLKFTDKVTHTTNRRVKTARVALSSFHRGQQSAQARPAEPAQQPTEHTCAHWTEYNQTCVFDTRNWSPSITPTRCLACPHRVYTAPTREVMETAVVRQEIESDFGHRWVLEPWKTGAEIAADMVEDALANAPAREPTAASKRATNGGEKGR